MSLSQGRSVLRTKAVAAFDKKSVAAMALALTAVLVAIGAVAKWQGSARPSAGVLYHFPAHGAERTPGTTNILVTFSRELAADAERVELMVTDASGERIDGATEITSTLRAATFEPMAMLPPGTYSVQVRLKPVGALEEVELRSWSFDVAEPTVSPSGSRASLLVIAEPGTKDQYLAEILRAEGFTVFDVIAPGQVTAPRLDDAAVVLVGAEVSQGGHVVRLEEWVADGGHLIVMRPDGRLADLAGLTPGPGDVSDGYLRIDTSSPPGTGITGDPMQFHGDATRYRAHAGTRTVAALLTDVKRSASAPAVSLRDVGGQGGTVAAFSYDLATSVLHTRLGNPEWAKQERDGITPIRANDFFHGGEDDDHFLDLTRIGIPQADEQMRLLSNIITELHADSAPLARLWYLPNGEKAALVMTADDHATADGTKRSFEHIMSLDPQGCVVARWECGRATSWVYAESPLTDGEALRYADNGFDLGTHVNTHCQNWSPASLKTSFIRSLKLFKDKFPSLPDQTGNRLHCIVQSDWTTLAEAERDWGIRLDMNYYNWPPKWIDGRPGYMTGSALPMRFASTEGEVIDVFQQETHLVNETWSGSRHGIEALVEAAQGPKGYYGALGTHYDFSDDFDRELIDVATRYDVPMVSAQQLLDFTDGRHASSIRALSVSDSGTSVFAVHVDPRAADLLTAMVPVHASNGTLASLSSEGHDVPYEVRTVKGLDYAFFAAETGSVVAEYR